MAKAKVLTELQTELVTQFHKEELYKICAIFNQEFRRNVKQLDKAATWSPERKAYNLIRSKLCELLEEIEDITHS